MAQNGDEVGAARDRATEVRHHLDGLREDELIDLIRDTVSQLNNLGDRLEAHATRRQTRNREGE